MERKEIEGRIEENESMLKMAELHMDERACMVLRQRIFNLEKLLDEPLPPQPEKGEAKGMEEVLSKNYSCVCGEMYKIRKMVDPLCTYCEHGDTMKEMMSEWASLVSADKDSTIKELREALEITYKSLATYGSHPIIEIRVNAALNK